MRGGRDMAELVFSTWLEQQFNNTRVSAADIAKMADLSPGYLSGLRSNKRGNPSPEVTQKLAVVFAKMRKLSDEETNALIAEATLAAKMSAVLLVPRSQDLSLSEVPEPSLWHRLLTR